MRRSPPCWRFCNLFAGPPAERKLQRGLGPERAWSSYCGVPCACRQRCYEIRMVHCCLGKLKAMPRLSRCHCCATLSVATLRQTALWLRFAPCHQT
jgi:hypothetical protein